MFSSQERIALLKHVPQDTRTGCNILAKMDGNCGWATPHSAVRKGKSGEMRVIRSQSFHLRVGRATVAVFSSRTDENQVHQMPVLFRRGHFEDGRRAIRLHCAWLRLRFLNRPLESKTGENIALVR